MNIQAEKLEILKLILETDNPGIISSIKAIFKKESEIDFWDELSNEEKEDILEGIKHADNGDVIKYNEFIKKHNPDSQSL
jgi:hypothetical protein